MRLENVESHSGHGTPGRRPLTGYASQPWYQAYMTALFEPDPGQVVERIKNAERLIVSRAREVFSQSKSALERNALDRALQALHALEFCQGQAGQKVVGQSNDEE